MVFPTPGGPSRATLDLALTNSRTRPDRPDGHTTRPAQVGQSRPGDRDTQPYDTVVAVEPGCDPAPYAAAGATWWLVGVAADAARADLLRAIIRDGPASLA